MSLELLWFVLGALSLTVYVVLDGYDLGTGILHYLAPATRGERALAMKSIGPVWDGNEVWLLASGATLYFAFPTLYATAISGFYLPVNILLWLLAFRALGIEMKHHLHHPLWDEVWDAAFFGASLLITLFLGVALGNLVRGVSIDASGKFFAPLWTNFTVGEQVGILDWFTLLVGATATVSVGLHGATWLAHRVAGPLQERARKLIQPLAYATMGLLIITSAGLVVARPDLPASLASRPVVFALPLIALGGIAGALLFARQGQYGRAFAGSSVFLAGMVLTAAATIYPNVIVGRVAERSISAAAAKTGEYGLSVGLYWWIPGMLLATAYTLFLHRSLPRGLSEADIEHHDG